MAEQLRYHRNLSMRDKLLAAARAMSGRQINRFFLHFSDYRDQGTEFSGTAVDAPLSPRQETSIAEICLFTGKPTALIPQAKQIVKEQERLQERLSISEWMEAMRIPRIR